MAELWSDYADEIISSVDSAMSAKYGKVSIRKFLTNPGKYAGSPDMASNAQNMKNDVNAYLDTMLGELSSESKTLSDNLIKAESITTQLSQNISMQAKQNRLPLIKPITLDRDTTTDEIIYIDNVDSGVIALVEKLAAESVYIADSTTVYKDHKLGTWVFGGSKTYVVRAYLPQSEVILVENAKDELNYLFDLSMSYLQK